MMKSIRSPRMILVIFFDILTENFETCNFKLMNNSFTKKTSIVLAVQSVACCERNAKNVATVWRMWKQWNLLHNRGFFNSERVTISFYVQILQMKSTRQLQMKSWTEIVLRAWGSQMNLVAYMCKDELNRENVSLSITLNHKLRCSISSLYDISVNLFCSNALWCLTWDPTNETMSGRCTFVYCPASN